ncbi:AMP-binding protein [Rhodococcus pyridinivorans]|uniref:acyl-CoA synthetase n=1 Tax=Rhodococcus pyridinivorans TaxID=103816 RepID=UPI0022261061|nr:AMP-binding protein [Rhodococcus pyridinivorans]MCW3472710.1 AMP-binding protein [Rhodococcus pyridinivorans]
MTYDLQREREEIREELLAERALSVDDYWAKAESRADWPLSRGLNLAHECCDRWAVDRSRIAMSIHEPDGSVRRWTYYELMRASSEVANAFEAAGLKRGDRVAGILDQQVESYLCALGAWRAGMVYVPLFVGFGVEAIAQRINSAECAAVVVGHAHREVLSKVEPRLAAAPVIFSVAGADGAGVVDGDSDFWGALDEQSAEHSIVETALDEVATIIFTSGTTGDPKGCMHNHATLIFSLQSFLRHTMALGRGDVVFAGANPGWSFGLYTAGLGVQSLGIMRVLYTGPFDPEAWLKVIEKERITYMATAPSAYRPLISYLDSIGRSLPDSVRGGLSAGEPLTTTLTEGWASVGGGPLQDGYGSSEMGMVLANLAFDDRDLPPGCLTSPVPGFDVDIFDADGKPIEGEGMIGVRNMRWSIVGYKDLEEAWAKKTVNGVFMSGDLARKDDNGYFWFAGRSDDLIVTAGYNVGPAEVENIIAAIDGVQDVAVVAAPDEARGAVVRAFVVENGTVPREAIAEQIQARVREDLGRHAYPKIIDFLDALPRTETGKVRRNVLRELESDPS